MTDRKPIIYNSGTISELAAGDFLDIFGLKLRNTANTFVNIFANATTAARTWTLPDKDGTFAMTSDVAANPAGTIIAFAGSSVPTGYLQCATSVTNVSRTTYANLFAAIGTAWGAGDGSTTFGIPYFPLGFTPITGSTIGATSAGQMPSHTHSVVGIASNGSFGPTGAAPYPQGTSTTGFSGSGTNNLAAGMGVKFCVKF